MDVWDVLAAITATSALYGFLFFINDRRKRNQTRRGEVVRRIGRWTR
jgi:hypothetical protein